MKEYFSHDINARSDRKIKKLILANGYKGYGVYWAIVEYMHENEFPTEDIDMLAKDLNIDVDFMINILFNFGLFYKEGNLIKSKRVEQNRLLRSAISEKAKLSALTRWKKAKENATALLTQSEGNANKEKKNKEKKIIENGYGDY